MLQNQPLQFLGLDITSGNLLQDWFVYGLRPGCLSEHCGWILLPNLGNFSPYYILCSNVLWNIWVDIYRNRWGVVSSLFIQLCIALGGIPLVPGFRKFVHKRSIEAQANLVEKFKVA